MKIAIIFYSKSGNTRSIANIISTNLKDDHDIDLIEIEPVKHPGFFKAGHAALKQKELPIKNQPVDLTDYDVMIFGAPVWAGNPAPYVRSFLEKATGLEGKKCNFFLTLAGAPEKQTAALDIFHDLLTVNKLMVGNNNPAIRMNRKGVIKNEGVLNSFLDSI